MAESNTPAQPRRTSTHMHTCSNLSVGAYVEGRPMPSSSSALMREASVYRGGGRVKCCAGCTSCVLTACFT